MTTKMNTLTTLISLAEDYGFETRFYIDRLSVYFDARTSESDLLKLEKRSSKNKLIQPCTLEGHIHLSQKLELYQLDNTALKLLKRTCDSGGDYKINYIELALDFASQSQSDVEYLRQFFNRHLVRLSPKKPPHFHDEDGTYYFNKPADKDKLVMYSEKPYRWNTDLYCVHLECRYSGLEALKKLDIITVNDMTDFDHEAYWQKRLDLRKPSFKEIGLYLSEEDVSDKALNKKGNKFFDQLPSLQGFLNENTGLRKDERDTLFPAMNTDEAVEKFFVRAFE